MGKHDVGYLRMLRMNKAFKTHLQKWNIFYSVRIKWVRLRPGVIHDYPFREDKRLSTICNHILIYRAARSKHNVYLLHLMRYGHETVCMIYVIHWHTMYDTCHTLTDHISFRWHTSWIDRFNLKWTIEYNMQRYTDISCSTFETQRTSFAFDALRTWNCLYDTCHTLTRDIWYMSYTDRSCIISMTQVMD